MSDSYRTVNQAYQTGMQAIQSYNGHHTDTQDIDESDPSHATQEYPMRLRSDSNSINQLAYMYFSSSNTYGIHPNNTIEYSNSTTSLVFSYNNHPPALKQIQIKAQPRGNYHPRNVKECSKTTYYIRCDDIDKAEKHPTIFIKPEWRQTMIKNFIEVALVDKQRELHPYAINNKEMDPTTGVPIVSKLNNHPSILLFPLTNDDFVVGYKSFKIELIKSKQDDYINKEEIHRRELHISMLRFKYSFLDEYGVYHEDKDSTVYSCEMIEKYCNVVVHDVNPRYGPMGGNQQLNVVFIGLGAKNRNKVYFEIVEQSKRWTFMIKEFKFIGNTLFFSMPAFPYPSKNHILTSILVYYEGDIIFESPFIYILGLDQILEDFNVNEKIQTDVLTTTSKDNASSNSQATLIGFEGARKRNYTKRQYTKSKKIAK